MFTGFTDATVDFLWGIRFNNERPWFEAHKETYLSELYRPMKDLGAEIYEFLSERRPEDPMMCRVSRITGATAWAVGWPGPWTWPSCARGLSGTRSPWKS